MKTIYLVYSSDYESYIPYKCFARKYDAEEFITKLEKIREVVKNARIYPNQFITKPICRDKPFIDFKSYSYGNVIDSAVGGDLYMKAKEKYKNDLIEYEKELEKYRADYVAYNDKWDNLYISYIKDNLTEEEFKWFEKYQDSNDSIGIDELDYEDGNG